MLIRPQENPEPVSMQMTPLIDTVFLLLIFFLVATTFRQAEREMQIALPVAQSGQPLSATLRELVVNVDATGRIIVTGRPIEPPAFEDMVREAVAANPQQKVTVRGDRQAAYGHVVRVLDICKRSGIQEPYLDTVLE